MTSSPSHFLAQSRRVYGHRYWPFFLRASARTTHTSATTPSQSSHRPSTTEVHTMAVFRCRLTRKTTPCPKTTPATPANAPAHPTSTGGALLPQTAPSPPAPRPKITPPPPTPTHISAPFPPHSLPESQPTDATAHPINMGEPLLPTI